MVFPALPDTDDYPALNTTAATFFFITLSGNICQYMSRSYAMKVGHQIKVVSYYQPSQIAALNKLAETTRVRKAEYLREALDDLLKKYTLSVRDAPRKRQKRRAT